MLLNFTISDTFLAVLIVASLFAVTLRYQFFPLAVFLFLPYLPRIILVNYSMLYIIWGLMIFSLVYSTIRRRINLSGIAQSSGMIITLIIFSAYFLMNIYLPTNPLEDLGLFRLQSFGIRAIFPSLILIWLIRDRNDILEFLYISSFVMMVTLVISYSSVMENSTSLILDEVSNTAIGGVSRLEVASAAGLGGVIAFGLFLFKREKFWIGLPMLPFALGVIFFARARQGLVAILAALFVLVIFRSKNKVATGVIISAIIGFVYLVFFVLFPGTAMTSKFITMFEDPIAAGDTRYGYYSRAINDFLSSPIFGIGTSQYGDPNGWINDNGKWIFDKQHVHNFSLEILTEQGLVGFFIYVLFVIQVFKPLFSIRKDPEGEQYFIIFMMALTYAFTRTQFSGGVTVSMEMFWLPIFVFRSCTVILNKPIQAESVRESKNLSRLSSGRVVL